jgi:hypothetical protein
MLSPRRVSFSISEEVEPSSPKKKYSEQCFFPVRRPSQEKLLISETPSPLKGIQTELAKICQFGIKTLQAKSSDTSPNAHQLEMAGKLQAILDFVANATSFGELEKPLQDCTAYLSTVMTIYRAKHSLKKVTGLPTEPVSEIEQAQKNIAAHLVAITKSEHSLLRI